MPTGRTSDVFSALALGSGLMIVGGIAELMFGVKAGRRRLEGIAKPLTAVETAVRSGVARAGAAAGRAPSAAVAARSPSGT